MCNRLMPLAIANVLLHVIALIFAAFGLRPGSPLVTLPERINYLSHQPLGWSLGWATWMLCDFAVVAIIFLAARRIRNDLAMLAVGIVLSGAAVDLTCDTLFIAVLPSLASQQPVNEEIFLAVERLINTVSLVMGNGLITLSTMVMTVALFRLIGGSPWPQESREQVVSNNRNSRTALVLVAVLGISVLIFGLLLAATGFLADHRFTEWVTGPTI